MQLLCKNIQDMSLPSNNSIFIYKHQENQNHKIIQIDGQGRDLSIIF